MTYHLRGAILGLAAWAAFAVSAPAQTISPSVDKAVDACVLQSRVIGEYYVQPVQYRGVASLSVIPGGGVSAAQSKQINACIAKATQAAKRRNTRTFAAEPKNTAECFAEYKAKLNATDGGREYRGDNAGTRLIAGLFGRRLGPKILENEYDRCLDRIAYDYNRCPNGVFANGAGYCIRRPYR